MQPNLLVNLTHSLRPRCWTFLKLPSQESRYRKCNCIPPGELLVHGLLVRRKVGPSTTEQRLRSGVPMRLTINNRGFWSVQMVSLTRRRNPRSAL